MDPGATDTPPALPHAGSHHPISRLLYPVSGTHSPVCFIPAYGVFDLFDPLSLAAEMETFSRGSKLDALPPPSYADLLLMDPSSLGMMPTADEWAMLEEWGSSAGLVGAGVFGVGMFSPLAEIDDGVEPVQEGGGKAKKSRSGRALKPTARATEDADFEPEEEETTEGGAGGGSPGGVKRMTRNKNANATNAAKHSSTYRGVTKHRWTGRFEAHLWDSTVARGPSAAGSKRPRGRQIYLGGWGEEEQAARAYDMAAIKHWGVDALSAGAGSGGKNVLNFPLTEYLSELDKIAGMTTEDLVAELRRKSCGFARGKSKFRGVTQHHQHEGKWEARIGRVEGTKHVFLGSFSSELEAARAYDRAALHYRGPKAVTNFAPEAYSAENAAAAAAAAAEAGAEVAAPGMVQGVVAAGVAWGMGPTEIDMLGVLLLPAGAEKPASGVA